MVQLILGGFVAVLLLLQWRTERRIKALRADIAELTRPRGYQ